LFVSIFRDSIVSNEAFKRWKSFAALLVNLENVKRTEIVGLFYEDARKLGKNAPVPATGKFRQNLLALDSVAYGRVVSIETFYPLRIGYVLETLDIRNVLNVEWFAILSRVQHEVNYFPANFLFHFVISKAERAHALHDEAPLLAPLAAIESPKCVRSVKATVMLVDGTAKAKRRYRASLLTNFQPLKPTTGRPPMKARRRCLLSRQCH